MSVWSGFALRRVVSSLPAFSSVAGYPQPRKTQKCLSLRRHYGVQHSNTQVLTPSVLRLINEHSIDPSVLLGSGPQLHLKGSAKQGRLILKADVLDFIRNGKQAPPQTSIPSHQPTFTPQSSPFPKPAPHVYMSSSVNVEGLIKFEETLPSPLSANDVITFAMITSVRQNPSVNAILMDDGSRHSRGVDLSLSWVEGGEMQNCVLPNADKKGLMALEEGKRAGGSDSFSSISLTIATSPSLVSYSNIIQDPYHSCTVVVGPFLKTITLSRDGRPETVRVADVKISYDARVVQEEEAASFLSTFCRFLKNPYTLL